MDNTYGAASQRGLARLLGVAAKQVNKYVHDPRWRFGGGPWSASQVAEIRRWQQQTLMPNPSGPISAGSLTLERKVNVALKAERTKTERVRREILEEKYHRVDECEHRRILQIEEVKREILAVPESLPVDRATKDLVHDRLVAVCEKFANGG